MEAPLDLRIHDWRRVPEAHDDFRLLIPLPRLLEAVYDVDDTLLDGAWKVWTAWGCHDLRTCEIEDAVSARDGPLLVDGPTFFTPLIWFPRGYFEFLIMSRVVEGPLVGLGVFDSSWLWLRAAPELVREVAASFENTDIGPAHADYTRWH